MVVISRRAVPEKEPRVSAASSRKGVGSRRVSSRTSPKSIVVSRVISSLHEGFFVGKEHDTSITAPGHGIVGEARARALSRARW